MAEATSVKSDDVVPFFADADDYCRSASSSGTPVMVINPEASTLDLLQVAEARLQYLRRMLSILVCADCEVVFAPADYAEIFKPRVDEITILVEEANRRASEKQSISLRAVNAG